MSYIVERGRRAKPLAECVGGGEGVGTLSVHMFPLVIQYNQAKLITESDEGTLETTVNDRWYLKIMSLNSFVY